MHPFPTGPINYQPSTIINHPNHTPYPSLFFHKHIICICNREELLFQHHNLNSASPFITSNPPAQFPNQPNQPSFDSISNFQQ